MEEELVLLRKEFLQRIYHDKPGADATREEKAKWFESRSEEVSKMTNILNEDKEQLAPYDRMKYMDQLSDLIVRLHETRSEILPRPPFRFHRSNHVQQQTKSITGKQIREDTKLKRFENETLFLSNLSNETVDGNFFDNQEQRPIKLIVQGLRGCNVHIPSCSTVHINESNDCTFHFRNIQGSLHISQLINSRLYASSHQFRLHESNHLSIELHCQTSPVLEGCNNIIFKNPSAHPILDFSWARPEPSPNYQIRS
ncbi:tubulin specific chaperone cofactor C, GTPase activating protein Tbc1 [Schizosaccharomyces osmophilus]|uniref:Tubulin specific chaperone cofactor C, GTPase activating protein Tbc1 n=1 Tax=Schizosaccharomyces osmophilus TaxID=2545709 RepID=A0AAF0AY00_9SCHI|nr:tubulin specific chaperone cofactor C, GTPase activating protein Tbc1 [Schizosaccharomyces osmophilus]WBW74540.1 tubulin specific chaperone cofactor C, GTPase activating protein Tbc1 [Schizosaccharomyces osmophilus]